MLIPPADAEHFLGAYKALMACVAKSESLDSFDYLRARRALYKPKYLRKPPTDDPDLLAALKTAWYGDFIIARHLTRETEMIGPKERVYRVRGLTSELRDMTPPWVYGKTAVMEFKGHWICDGLIESQNIFIGSKMIRELTQTIRESRPPGRSKKKATGGKKGSTTRGGPSVKQNKQREERITMEIVVDAYDEMERAMGWYCYLEEKLHFPFEARCIEGRPISPLDEGDEVKVVGMPPSDECEHEMFVAVRWRRRELAVPLSQLEVSKADDETKQAVDDWHYWVSQGYGF